MRYLCKLNGILPITVVINNCNCFTGDVDFNTTNQTVTFTSGITTSNVSISVFNDTIVEGDEMFDLTLTVPELFNGMISTGSRDVAVGDIADNTSECD